jgi:hypothetical protein
MIARISGGAALETLDPLRLLCIEKTASFRLKYSMVGS